MSDIVNQWDVDQWYRSPTMKQWYRKGKVDILESRFDLWYLVKVSSILYEVKYCVVLKDDILITSFSMVCFKDTWLLYCFRYSVATWVESKHVFLRSQIKLYMYWNRSIDFDRWIDGSIGCEKRKMSENESEMSSLTSKLDKFDGS